jgi:predicted exporter
MPEKTRDPGESAWLGRLWSSIASLPRPRWLGAAVVLACVAILAFGSAPMWQNDLGQLTPIPQPLLETDARLRQELGAADIRRLLVVEGATADEVLASLESLQPELDGLVQRGAIESYDTAARYLPSTARQRQRQQALPDTGALRAALTQATAGLPFKANLFEPFINDVAKAKTLPPLTPQALAGTPLELRVGALLLHHGDQWTGLVTMGGVRDVAALEHLAVTHASSSAAKESAPKNSGPKDSSAANNSQQISSRPTPAANEPSPTNSAATLTVLDLKQASEALVSRQRTRILWSLAIAAVLLAITILAALRSPKRMLRVIAPMALTTLLILAILHGLGISLNLFHLIALVLAAGLGVDYALFFEAVEDDPAEQRRTLHAVLVCSLSTLLVFAALAASTLPVLRAIGVTVTLGIVSNFILALLLTRPAPEVPHARP